MTLPTSELDHILEHTRELWEEMRGQKFFITGGTGFFGCWLLESFARANDRLKLNASATVLTRDPKSFAAKMPHLAQRADLIFVDGDVRNFVFPKGEFNFVIHAGTTSSAPVEPQEMFDTIVAGTKRVLQFAGSCQARKLLFVSSGAVYGRQPSELTHLSENYEGAPNNLDPASAYGEGKRAAELLSLLASQKYGFEVKIARCFAFLGPYLPLDAHFAIGNFIRNGLQNQAIQVGGDGTPFRAYLYAADLAIWLWTILFRGKSGCAYNVGSEDALSIEAIANLVARQFNPPREVKIAKVPIANMPTQRYIPSTLRARTELNLQQRIDLPEAIRRTILWIKTTDHQINNQNKQL